MSSANAKKQYASA